jgi:hypothetical protein
MSNEEQVDGCYWYYPWMDFKMEWNGLTVGYHNTFISIAHEVVQSQRELALYTPHSLPKHSIQRLQNED